MEDEPMIPQERPEDRPRVAADDLARTFALLDLSSNAFARRWDTDRSRTRRWLYGDEDAPRWLENGLVLIYTVLSLKRRLEAEQAAAGEPIFGPEIELCASTLERMTGNRYPPEQPPVHETA